MKEEREKFKYSILMSVYYKENPEWLKISIDSMLNQTIKANEFIIVEDGKLTEKLDEVIEYYKEKYSNLFKIIKLEKNMGLGPALEIGVNACTNEWIARMDSDDYSVPDRCEKQINKILEDKELDIVGSSIAEFENSIENIISYRNLPETNEEIYKYAKRRNPFGHPSVMLKKSKVLEAGNYRSYYLCEDYDMWVRMLECNAKCYNFQEILVYMRISKDFYARRGGLKYLKSILKFKKELRNKKFYSYKDYIISSGSHVIVCILPNSIRDFVYRKLLRKSPKKNGGYLLNAK